jgi:hypothetical protein
LQGKELFQQHRTQAMQPRLPYKQSDAIELWKVFELVKAEMLLLLLTEMKRKKKV